MGKPVALTLRPRVVDEHRSETKFAIIERLERDIAGPTEGEGQ
jgi:hypothetical protein